MGMYDEVEARCPSCGDGVVVFQSKAGECTLQRYNSENVPFGIAESIDGDCEDCPRCGHPVTIKLPFNSARMMVI